MQEQIAKNVELTLTTVKAGCVKVIPEGILQSLKAEVSECFASGMREMALKLTAKMLADQEVSYAERTEEVPADWWQHFRQRWFPVWWLKQYPVKTKPIAVQVRTNVYRCCPHIPLCDDGRYEHCFRYLGRDD